MAGEHSGSPVTVSDLLVLRDDLSEIKVALADLDAKNYFALRQNRGGLTRPQICIAVACLPALRCLYGALGCWALPRRSPLAIACALTAARAVVAV